MRQPLSSQQLLLHGEVIEIVQRGESKMMKINLHQGTVDLPMCMEDEPHLGDSVAVDVFLTIRSVEPAVFVD